MLKHWHPRLLLEPIEIESADIVPVEEPVTTRYWSVLSAAERTWAKSIVRGVEDLAQKTAWAPAERKYWRRIILTKCPSEAAALYMAVWIRDCAAFRRTLLVRDGEPSRQHEIVYMLQIFWPIEWDVAGEDLKAQTA